VDAASATSSNKLVNCTLTNTALPRIKIAKTSVGGVGSFNFSLTGVTNPSDSVTTTVAGSAPVTSSATHIGTLNTAATITELNPVGYSTAVSCVDANNGSTLIPRSTQPQEL
jgi:hypothetical protein